MKKLRHTLLTLLLAFVATSAYADKFEANGIYYQVMSAFRKTCMVIKGENQYQGDISIPASVTHEGRTFRVENIGYEAFKDCKLLTSVNIPNSVTSIDRYAFKDCEGLRSVTIPSSVTSIGWYAFAGCKSLTSITLPNGVTGIGWCAFADCENLKSITIPNSVTSIGEGAFSGCRNLPSVTIPNSVINIGEGAFQSCDKLNTIISLATTPPTLSDSKLSQQQKETVKVLVPKGTLAAYQAADVWKDFLHIEEADITAGISHVSTHADEVHEIARYTVAGKRITGKHSGINIIKMSDGTTRKVMVK